MAWKRGVLWITHRHSATNMNDLTTTVYLTQDEVEQFVLFQKRRAFIGLLESINAFEIKDGSITIHFNHNGEIKTVDKHEAYRI